jgi:choline dehydrogenase-like flavoprotein
MKQLDGGTVIIGSGVAGTLVARELIRRGQRCTIVERGAHVPWEVQRRERRWEADDGTSRHSHENDESGVDHPWTYVYAVGGSCNRWAGTCPRFLPEDFEMRSRYGVMRDWPISYAELAPHYLSAERALGVAGAANAFTPDPDYPQPPHPLSRQDRAIAPHLGPVVPLAQARPTRAVGGRAACCASGRCQLCPVDARFSVLNALRDVLESPLVELLTGTVAARLVTARSGRVVEAVECVREDGERLLVHGERFVLAANGIESPALLLRSGIETEDTGRFLFDHRNAKLLVPTRTDVGPGHGNSLATGASYAYYSGSFRSRRAAVLIVPFNPGPPTMLDGVVGRLLDGTRGPRLRREVAAEWRRTLALDLYLDDLPDRANGVRLSPRKDSLGIPRTVVRFRPPTTYLRSAVRYLLDDVPRRLRPLGAREARYQPAPQGAHLLGTLRMGGAGDGVVDSDQRHRARENVFVAGGAVFPTYSPTHPTLTLAALSIRLGRMLARGSA